jgi:thiol-disulfide isomerase/thioredoxin
MASKSNGNPNHSGRLRGPAAKRTLIALLAVAGLGLVAACGSTVVSESRPTGSDTQPNDATGPDQTLNLEVPDFTILAYQGAAEIGGQEVTLAEMLSTAGRPVVLNFWAGLCSPCRAEMPDIQEVFDERRQDVLIMGIDVGPFILLGSREEGKALLIEMGVTYPAGTTFDSAVVRDFQILGMPTTIFLKPNGEVQRRWTGLLTAGKMNELIDDLIAES